MRRLTSLACLLALGGCAMMQPQQAEAPASGMPTHVVFFGEWSAALADPGLQIIAAAAKAAEAHPTATVTVVGYADPTGSPQANILMSQTRAQVVTDQLVRDGVAPSRVLHTGHGPTDFTSGSQESRRVEIDIGG